MFLAAQPASDCIPKSALSLGPYLCEKDKLEHSAEAT